MPRTDTLDDYKKINYRCNKGWLFQSMLAVKCSGAISSYLLFHAVQA